MRHAFTIIGSGFGLYGYMPAISHTTNCNVILPEKYRRVVENRPELYRYIQNIIWESSTERALSRSSGVVLAVPPWIQPSIAEDVICFNNITHLILEKPLAVCPHKSRLLLDKISLTHKRFRVGYIFLYSNWYKKLKSEDHECSYEFIITWKFKAHHFRHNLDNWKRKHSKGGGAIRFYGIHLIAVLASLGYSTIIKSETYDVVFDQPTIWNASFSGLGLPKCTIILSTNSDVDIFSVQSSTSLNTLDNIYSDKSPFDLSRSTQGQDVRALTLERLIQSLLCDSNDEVPLYTAINNLWTTIEEYSFPSTL